MLLVSEGRVGKTAGTDKSSVRNKVLREDRNLSDVVSIRV